MPAKAVAARVDAGKRPKSMDAWLRRAADIAARRYRDETSIFPGKMPLSIGKHDKCLTLRTGRLLFRTPRKWEPIAQR